MTGWSTDPLHFDYDDIRKLAPYETTLTLECISNEIAGGLIDTANWRGTLLRPLLERAGLKPNAKYAILYAAEGYTTGHTIERLMRAANFLAYDMDGEPLTRIHGFPLRVLMPGIYGMKTPKWLTRIELVDKSHLGYWEWMGWSDTGERQLQSVIDDPHEARADRGAKFCGDRMGGRERSGRRESGNLNGRRRDLESLPDFQQSHAVAGVGVLALRVGQSAERQARNSSARHGRERQSADLVPVGRVAGRGDGVSHGYGECDVIRDVRNSASRWRVFSVAHALACGIEFCQTITS